MDAVFYIGLTQTAHFVWPRNQGAQATIISSLSFLLHRRRNDPAFVFLTGTVQVV